MMQVGLGVLGIPPSEFWNMTFREYFNAVDGFNKHQERKRRKDLTMHRLFAACIVQPHYSKAIEPTDLVEFDFDKELKKLKYVDGDPTKLTPEMKEAMDKWDKYAEENAQRR